MPSVSVLMCTNRLDAYLRRALESVLSQRFEDFDFVIVGNGLSSDDSEKLKKI